MDSPPAYAGAPPPAAAAAAANELMTENSPPSYDNVAPADDPEEPQPPTILQMSGRLIHSADSLHSSPFYELSRASKTMSDLNQTVLLERCLYTVKTSTAPGDGGAVPQVRCRRKTIFNMRRPPAITAPVFPAVLEKASRSALANIGLKQSGSGSGGGLSSRKARSTIQAVRIVGGKQGGEVFFTAERRKGEPWEWHDAQGSLVASEDEGDGIFRLLVTRVLPRKLFDALVGLWCLRLWDEFATMSRQDSNRSDVRSIWWDESWGTK